MVKSPVQLLTKSKECWIVCTCSSTERCWCCTGSSWIPALHCGFIVWTTRQRHLKGSPISPVGGQFELGLHVSQQVPCQPQKVSGVVTLALGPVKVHLLDVHLHWQQLNLDGIRRAGSWQRHTVNELNIWLFNDNNSVLPKFVPAWPSTGSLIELLHAPSEALTEKM